jgi:carboxymethylenebutenolidase
MAEQLAIATAGGTMMAYLARPPSSSPPLGGVVVLQEIFGVNEDLRQTCDWLASQGFLALCPDLFWRLEPGVDMQEGPPENWQRGFALYTAYDRDQGVADVAAALRTAREMAGSAGVMGFCLGGLMTFRTAALQGADAAVAYYGGETEKYVAEAAGLRTPLMMHLADEDEYMPREAQAAIHAALDGRPQVEVHGYPGCRHAFARNGGTHYDAQAATLAHERTLRFLFKHLR